MNYNQNTKADITSLNANTLINARGELHRQQKDKIAEQERYYQDDQGHKPARPPKRTSEDERLETLGYCF